MSQTLDTVVAKQQTMPEKGRLPAVLVPEPVPTMVVGHETGQGWWKEEDLAGTLRAEGENRPSRPSHVVAYGLTGDPTPKSGEDVMPTLRAEQGGEGRCVAYDLTQATSVENRSNPKPGSPCHTLAAGARPPVVVTQYGEDIAGTLTARADGSPCPDRGPNVVAAPHVDCLPCMTSGAHTEAGHNAVSGHMKDKYVVPVTDGQAWAVRRLLPVECERLMGFPDGWTDVPHRGKPAADGPRYRALGNSKAVPVVRWIGRRIACALRG